MLPLHEVSTEKREHL
jgi:hypothetical protein